MGKTIGIIFGIVQMILGLIFLVSAVSAGMVARYIFAGVFLLSGIAVLYVITRKPKVTEVRAVQQLELRGGEQLQELSCKKCGGALSRQNVKILNGIVTVDCPYCNQMYEMTEELQW